MGTDTGQAASASAPLLDSRETSARSVESLGISGVDDALLADLQRPLVEQWGARAQWAPRVTQRAYAARRAKALARPLVERLDDCERKGLWIRCGCGPRRVPWGCGRRLACAWCRRRWCRRQRHRIRTGLELALRALQKRGQRIGPRGWRTVLVTLTIAHSGDVERDHAELTEGWRRFHRRMTRRWGSWGYVGVMEVTPGRDGLGHVHWHLVCVWPWRDWSLARHHWKASCPRSEQISFECAKYGARGAANYVAKYMSKGVEVGNFAPQLAARVMAFAYGKRWLCSSVGFLDATERHSCGSCDCPFVQVPFARAAQPCGPVSDPSLHVQCFGWSYHGPPLPPQRAFRW